jgi:hypothetical protein
MAGESIKNMIRSIVTGIKAFKEELIYCRSERKQKLLR